MLDRIHHHHSALRVSDLRGRAGVITMGRFEHQSVTETNTHMADTVKAGAKESQITEIGGLDVSNRSALTNKVIVDALGVESLRECTSSIFEGSFCET